MKKTVIAITLMALLISTITAVFLEPNVQTASASSNSVPNLLWKTNLTFPSGSNNTARSLSAPTVANGVVYVGVLSAVNTFPPYLPNPPPYNPNDNWSDFYAFNASNGAVIWDYKDPSASYFVSSSVVADGIVFFCRGPNENGIIKALNASTGVLLWNFTVNGGISSPTEANGVVFIVGDRNIYALNATNGDKIWDASNYGGTSPIIVNGVLYMGSSVDSNLNALNASNGERIWNYTAENRPATPAVASGVVYFSAGQNIYALNAATGIKLWNYSTKVVLSNYGYGMNYEFSSPTFANGILYVFSNREQTMLALKASDGVKLWNYTRAVGNPPIVANGVVYVDINGYLSALNAYDGRKIWDSSLPADDFNLVPPKSPAVADGVMYFANNYENLYAYKILSSTSPPASETAVSVFTGNGQTVNFTIGGNVTSSQISNVYLTTDQNATTASVYLTVTGESGTAGFSNMTIPKNLIPDGTTPTIYIDNQKAEKQGYTQHTDNYYVWYTTGFSSHQISIMFSKSQNVESSSLPNYVIWLGAVFTALIITVTVIVIFKKRSMRSIS
jgi:outer membrane protein assembly factor BamB